MSFLSKLFGGGGTSVIEALGNAIDRNVTSDDERNAALLALTKLRQVPQLAQAKITEVEAANPALFVSGWRPALGWVCVMGIGYQFVARPLLQWLTNIFIVLLEIDDPDQLLALPALEVAELIALVVALLGVAGYRTIEKTKGVGRS